MFKAKIFCSRCNKIVRIAGRIWEYRLGYSKKDAQGHYLGWNCDRCANAIESGSDY